MRTRWASRSGCSQPADYTDSDGDGIWSSIKDDKDALALRVGSGLELRISGIIRPKEDATSDRDDRYFRLHAQADRVSD